MPTDEEKAQKIEPRPMYCFLLDIDEELEEPPPQLALRPDLEVDDIVCNRLHNSDPQLWAWSQVGKGRCLWKAVLRGYTRSSDGRRLNITGDPQRPAWIGDDWYRKLQRKEKAAAGKGKQRGRCSSSPTFLPDPLTLRSLLAVSHEYIPCINSHIPVPCLCRVRHYVSVRLYPCSLLAMTLRFSVLIVYCITCVRCRGYVGLSRRQPGAILACHPYPLTPPSPRTIRPYHVS